ncbi:MAG: flagellar hook-length control protein FliK [Aquitalea sp.]|nr:flagellar hook-length control protein FliK [Aquitalea sp.]
MTITVIPAASAKASMPQGQADASGQDSGGLFASLLGAQMGGLNNALTGQPDIGSGDGKSKQDKDSAASDNTTASDVSPNMLFAAMPLLQAAMPQMPQQQKPVVSATPDAMTADIKNVTTDALLQNTLALKNLKGQPAQELPGKDDTALQFLPPDAEQLANASQASNQAAQAAQSVQATQSKTLTISQPMTDPNWSKALGDQVLSMVSMKMDKATIQVNPPQLGPVEVTLKMNGNDQAQVIFTSAVPATREIIENNMPKLVSMMASSGIALADAQVSSGQSGNRQQQFNQNQNGRRQNAAGNDEDDTLTAIKSARGILSIFA